MTSSRILVASGDKAIRNILVSSLIKSGYQVIEVGSGDAALAAMLDGRMGIMLAILDGQLPPVSGNRVVTELRRVGNELPVILTSGSFIVDELPVADGRLAFIAKPFDLDELIRSVKGLLANRPVQEP